MWEPSELGHQRTVRAPYKEMRAKDGGELPARMRARILEARIDPAGLL
jgi:hypothetical protein